MERFRKFMPALLLLASACAPATLEMHVEREINAPADEVWDVLGRQFAEMDEWSSIVTDSRAMTDEEVPSHVAAAPGAPVPGRAVMLKGHEAREVLVDYSNERREFEFVAVKQPKILLSAANRTRVEERDGGSVVTMDITIEAKNGLVKRALQKRMPPTYAQVLADLEAHVEGH